MSQPRNAVDQVVITRSRLQEVIDEAVERGRITRADGSDLVAALVSEIGRAPRRLTGRGPELPIGGYDDLTAAEVVARLDGMDDADLRRLAAYEKANANRKTVLGAIERTLA